MPLARRFSFKRFHEAPGSPLMTEPRVCAMDLGQIRSSYTLSASGPTADAPLLLLHA